MGVLSGLLWSKAQNTPYFVLLKAETISKRTNQVGFCAFDFRKIPSPAIWKMDGREYPEIFKRSAVRTVNIRFLRRSPEESERVSSCCRYMNRGLHRG
jgi:hypothetical protein